MSLAIKIFEPDPGAPDPGSLDDLVEQYLDNLRRRIAVSKYTQEAFDRAARYLGNFRRWADPQITQNLRLGCLLIGEAKQRHFTAWLTAHGDKWRSGSTLADAIGSVLAAFNWLEEEELIERNPFHKPKKLKIVKTPRQHMKRQHYVALMRAAMARVPKERKKHSPKFRKGSKPLQRALLLLYRAGPRPKEMRDLIWPQVIWDDRGCRLANHKTRHQTGEDRIFGLGDKVYRMLRRLYERRPVGEEHVFLNNENKPWTKDGWCRHFARYAAAAGIPKGVASYGARHGFVVAQVKAGTPIKWIADQCGHADTRTTERIYAAATRSDMTHVAGVAKTCERAKAPEELQEAQRRSEVRRKVREKADTPLFDSLD